jgi:hypothetical protein
VLRSLLPRRSPSRLPPPRRSLKERLVIAGVTAFGLALLTLVLLVAYVGSARPGLDAVDGLFLLVAAIHLVRGTRKGEPLRGMRFAVLCAALPIAHVTQDFITVTVLFGGTALLLMLVQFLVAIVPRRRWWP